MQQGEKAIPITCGQFKKTGIDFATIRRSEIEWTAAESQTFNHFPFCQSSSEVKRVLSGSFWKATASRGWMFQARPCAALVETRPTRQRCFASTTSSTWARRPRSCIGRWLSWNNAPEMINICVQWNYDHIFQCQLHNEPFTMFCTTKKTMLCMKCFRWELEISLKSYSTYLNNKGHQS